MSEDDIDCSLSFERPPGSASVSERAAEEKNGFWDSTILADSESDDGEADQNNGNRSILFFLNEAGIEISMHVSHLENSKTNRAFHASIDTILDWERARLLRDFLSFILKWQQEESDDKV